MVAVMSRERLIVEWLLNADFCRKMAERTADSARKAVWLNLAQQWLMLGDLSVSEKVDKQFVAAVQDKSTRQKRPPSCN
jgi:hypothetical protein